MGNIAIIERNTVLRDLENIGEENNSRMRVYRLSTIYILFISPIYLLNFSHLLFILSFSFFLSFLFFLLLVFIDDVPAIGASSNQRANNNQHSNHNYPNPDFTSFFGSRCCSLLLRS